MSEGLLLSPLNGAKGKRQNPAAIVPIMKRRTLTATLVFLLAFGLSGWKLLSLRQGLVEQNEAIETSWQSLTKALDRRADALAAIVEAVASVAPRERKLYEALEAAQKDLRNARTPAEKIAAHRRLDQGMSRVLLVAESYPQLQAKDGYRGLTDELAAAESNLAAERRRYNDLVQDYNKNIELFPDHLAASLFGFHRNEAYFNTARDLLVNPAAAKP